MDHLHKAQEERFEIRFPTQAKTANPFVENNTDVGTGTLFGDLCKRTRIDLGLTLRLFCRKHSLDHVEISKTERGRIVPSRATRDKLAVALELEGADLTTFQFLAVVDVADNQQNLGSLPLLWQGTGTFTEETLVALAERIIDA